MLNRWCLKHVIDGDTLRLKDGRKLRLASINAPELPRDDKAGEPFGEQSRQVLVRLLSSQKKLLLVSGKEGKDRYGRSLGRLFLEDGTSVEAVLLRQGLAFQVFFDSPDAYQTCLSRQEAQARQEKLGVWRGDLVQRSTSKLLTPGFSLIRGTVVRVSAARNGEFIWVELDGEVVLRLVSEAFSTAGGWLKTLPGKDIEVRGWMIDRQALKKTLKKGHKRWMVLVYQKESINTRP